jgi:CheY-like chemotaxis protein
VAVCRLWDSSSLYAAGCPRVNLDRSEFDSGLAGSLKTSHWAQAIKEGAPSLVNRSPMGTGVLRKMQMPSIRTIRLLVVEDDPGYLYLIQDAFDARGQPARWHLTTAKDGEEALHLLFEVEQESAPLPDLILLDWNLPRVTGAEVLRRVKQHRQLRKIPVLVFSSSEADKDIEAAYDNHANGYVTKPGSSDALAAIVEIIERFWIGIAQLPRVLRAADTPS